MSSKHGSWQRVVGSMGIKVLQPGLQTTVQDTGRHGLQQYGVPVSGVMDSYAAGLANRLVGNAVDAALLEITVQGPVLSFERDALIALCGAPFALTINGEPQPAWECLAVKGGDILAVGSTRYGCRSYLAVSGGIDVPAVMGSRSTFLRGAFGGRDGRRLIVDDFLPLGEPSGAGVPGTFVLRKHWSRGFLPTEEVSVRVMLGPQDDLFTKEAIEMLATETYVVSADSDRMGYRLQGPSLTHVGKADILSDGISPGSIQVPGHGQPIVMLADRQTTGGYAKIATVIGADLPLMAQLTPSCRLRFQIVDRSLALAALRELISQAERALQSPQYTKDYTVRIGGKDLRVRMQEIREV